MGINTSYLQLSHFEIWAQFSSLKKKQIADGKYGLFQILEEPSI